MYNYPEGPRAACIHLFGSVQDSATSSSGSVMAAWACCRRMTDMFWVKFWRQIYAECWCLVRVSVRHRYNCLSTSYSAVWTPQIPQSTLPVW